MNRKEIKALINMIEAAKKKAAIGYQIELCCILRDCENGLREKIK